MYFIIIINCRKRPCCKHTLHVYTDNSAIKNRFVFSRNACGFVRKCVAENNVKGLGKQNVYEGPHR